MRKQIGEVVTYIDPYGNEFSALVTAVWGEYCINLLYVSGDESKTDPYGRQIARESSCVHESLNEAKRNCWR